MKPADTTIATTVQVVAIMPFFRYAVGPTSQHSPAIPYFTLKGAEACFKEVTQELPWAGARIYRRTWRGLVTVREYRPNAQKEAREDRAGKDV
jgi:hypothetical protein